MNKQKTSHSHILHKLSRTRHNCYTHVGRNSQATHNHRRNGCKTSVTRRSTFAYNVEHKLLAKNPFPASDLEKGWVIDSGASAHMTPFRRDCKDIQQSHRKIFLADGSTVICKIGRAHV